MTPYLLSAELSLFDELSIMWITIAAFLVFFMHAGFTLLESGMTQSKNAVNIAMKNLMAISVGTVVYWFIGYSLMFGETSNGVFRWSGFFSSLDSPESHLLFFQTMFFKIDNYIIFMLEPRI